MKWEKLHREKHSSNNGWLVELVSMEYDDEPFEDVHSYIVNFKPDTVRAMHYHKKKKEWLALGSGKIKIVLEDIDDGERETLILSEDDDEQRIVYLPPRVAHVIKNIGNKKACVIAFSKTSEMPEDTIEYEMEV